jgi:hypothetical protein
MAISKLVLEVRPVGDHCTCGPMRSLLCGGQGKTGRVETFLILINYTVASVHSLELFGNVAWHLLFNK